MKLMGWNMGVALAALAVGAGSVYLLGRVARWALRRVFGRLGNGRGPWAPRP